MLPLTWPPSPAAATPCCSACPTRRPSPGPWPSSRRRAPGLLLLDASVLTPEEARPIADAALAEGSTYVQTPITEAVEDVGRWTVQMSGPPAAYPTVARLLAPLATDVVHVGAVGGGAV